MSLRDGGDSTYSRYGLTGIPAAFAVSGCGGSPSAPPAEGPAPGPYRGSEPPEQLAMPDFSLRDQNGTRVDTSQFRGRVTLVTFLDSQCTEACPVIAFQVARALDRLSPSERKQVDALAISTDPVEDTQAAVRVFLAKQRAQGRLRYLGSGEALHRLRKVWRSLKVLASVETGADALHSAPVRIYDRGQRWVATLHAGVDLTRENLVHDLRMALRS